MNREIKFRGKSVDGVWRYGSLLCCGSDQPTRIVPCGFSHNDRAIKVDENTVNQFTGLYDMCGNPIYEGDILRYPPRDEREDNEYTAFEVFYHDNDACDNHIGWQINRTHHHGAYQSPPPFMPRGTKRLIIIGNIHDNPELIN